MLDSQFRSDEVAAIVSPSRQIARMLAFEGALAEAQGELGLIPAPAARVIASVCADIGTAATIDLADASLAGNPAIPFVRGLKARVQARDAEASRWVHFGATSQDVIDTASMLAWREIFALIDSDLARLRDRLAALAKEHASTPLAARTLLQQAAPTTFGFKAVAWLAGLDDSARRLRHAMEADLALQLGGPVGTLASAADKAEQLIDSVAAKLQLARPALSWHTSRERIAHGGALLATLTGQLGKIARDITLEMQTEVGELAEGRVPGKGGSSSMPHKHNPVDSLIAVAAATVAPQLAAGLLAAMVQEHERGAGNWHAEFMLAPQLCQVTHRALRSVVNTMHTLTIDAARMRSNLEVTRKLTAASPAEVAASLEAARDRTLNYLERRTSGPEKRNG